jgi:hypothetical protein
MKRYMRRMKTKRQEMNLKIGIVLCTPHWTAEMNSRCVSQNVSPSAAGSAHNASSGTSLNASRGGVARRGQILETKYKNTFKKRNGDFRLKEKDKTKQVCDGPSKKCLGVYAVATESMAASTAER